MAEANSLQPIDPGVDIGHVHLKVADIDRALDFYVGVLGFELTTRMGPDAAFISAGGYHHHIGLNTWQSRGGSPPAPGTTGLFHAAIRYPTRRALGAREVELIGDSELIVKQVKGEYRVKDPGLRPLHAEVRAALDGFDRWAIRHVRREHNEAADRLVNETLDETAG